MNRRISLALAVIAVVCLAVAVPTTASAATKTDKAQNKRLKSQTKSLKAAAKAIKTLGSSSKSAGSAINALKVIAARADGNAATVVAAAPAILNGLTSLKTGLEGASAGLKGLQTAAAATEYGWIETNVTGGTPSFFLTPDIPDSAQQAQTSQTSKAITGAVAVTTRFGVRGNESDGDGTTAAASCVVAIINLTTGAETASAFTPVPTKSTFTAVAGSPFAVLNGADVPIAGPSLAVANGDQYTVRFACVDTTTSTTDPSA